MPKNTFEDMVRVKRAKQAGNVSSNTPQKIEVKTKIEVEKKPENVFVEKNSNSSRHGMWLAAIVSVIFLIFAVAFLFTQAKITINPKIQNLVLDENISASKDQNNGTLSFDLVVISGEESKILKGEAMENVSKSATGTVVLYNTFSTGSQPLSIDTRLEGSNGKMYKTDKKITVPGMSANGTPGSVEVGIYATEAGVEYNSTPLDFKIFGFKGTPKYAKFYARSKGDIAGGFVGDLSVVTPEAKSQALSDLKTILQAKLLKKATDQIPKGFILFKDAVSLQIDEESVDQTVLTGDVPAKVRGTLYGFLFDEKELTNEIVKNAVKDYDDAEVYIPNIKDFVFSYTSSGTSFKDAQSINFNLTGTSQVVWKIDEEKIIIDTLSQKKKDFEKILSEYANIDSADVVIRPFWKRSFPDKIDKIKVIVNYP